MLPKLKFTLLGSSVIIQIVITTIFFVACKTPSQTSIINGPPGLSTPTQATTLLSHEVPADLKTMALITTHLNVRRRPGTQFEKIGLLEANSQILVLDISEDGQWLQIPYAEAPNGLGWISASYTTISTIAIPSQDQVMDGTATYHLQLTLSPNTVHQSACARLWYEAENMSDLQLNGEALRTGNNRGSKVVCPNVTTVYHLSGRDTTNNFVSHSVTLTVLAREIQDTHQVGAMPVSTTRGCRFAVQTLGTARPGLCRFSPDGTRIAAPARDGSLWVISTSGVSYHQIINPVGRFTIAGDVLWSPAGTYLAFSTTGLDGFGLGIGYYDFTTQTITYFGPDAQSGTTIELTNPRWTGDGRLIVTWHKDTTNPASLVSILDPLLYALDGPTPLAPDTELEMSAGRRGQQIFPWELGKLWRVGEQPSYEVDF